MADFEGGRIISDAGGLLFRELDWRYRLTDKAARYLHDPRDSRQVKYDLLALVRQRRFAIAQGYEDDNDAATLARGPALKIMAGKAPESGAPGLGISLPRPVGPGVAKPAGPHSPHSIRRAAPGDRCVQNRP